MEIFRRRRFKAVTKDEFLTALTAAVKMLIQNCDYSNDAIECMLETATAPDLPAHLRKKSKMRFLQI